MKKLLILLCATFIGLFAKTTTLNAQTETMASSTQIDEKTQKQIDKAKADLAKDQEKLTKMQADLVKEQTKFDKQQAKGKLSPNDITKGQHSLDKAKADTEHLMKKIADNQKFLDSFKTPMPNKESE